MRQIILDTETTGLSVGKGHRVVEIGCIELIERRQTGRKFQRYLNPQRPMDHGAQEVTGLSDEFLSDKPLFADVAEEFVDFVRGAELVIHNASFDVGFLNGELARLGGYPPLDEMCGVLDSLQLARDRFPGQRNALDALCKRLGVDNTHRTLHGALLDAQLLCDVYLYLTAGQGDLCLDAQAAAEPSGGAGRARSEAAQFAVILRAAKADEWSRHRARVSALGGLAAGVWCDDSSSTHDGQQEVA
jgi:DNA polymerase-3 subunit epsilon